MIPDTTTNWDCSPTSLQNSYVICATPRTGSNLLAFTLAAQGIGIPLEYFNIFHNGKINRFMLRTLNISNTNRTFSLTHKQLKLLRKKYITKLLKSRTTENGIFGIKIFPRHIVSLFPEDMTMLPLCTHLCSNPKMIHLHRKDLCKMAVSYYFAENKATWHSEMTAPPSNDQTPSYDFEKLLLRLKSLHEEQLSWKVLLKDTTPDNILSMNYQNLSQDFTNTIEATNRFLGVHDVEVPPESIKKQSSPEKTAMVERFKEECRIKEPWVFDVDYSINAGTVL